MGTITLTEFGRGADITKNPSLLEPGVARVSQNMLHNRGLNRAELRRGITRMGWHTRATAVQVAGAYEYITSAGAFLRMMVQEETLYSFILSLDTLTSFKTGLTKNKINRFSTYQNLWHMTNRLIANYIGNTTNAYPLQVAAPATALTAAAAAGAGLTAGTYYWSYARYSSVTLETSPAVATAPSAAVSGGNLRGLVTAAGLATTEQFDQVRIYRTKVNSVGPFYLVTTTTVAALAAGYTDSTADSALLTRSLVHTDAGASKTTKPEAASDLVLHRGRMHLIGLDGARSRHRWSQLFGLIYDSTTDARHDVEPDDGDNLWRGFSFDGALVLMKDRSIHLMNGDVEERGFTWQVAKGCGRENGIGAYCPYTAAQTPAGICFMAENGVYLWRPGMSEPKNIGLPIQDDIDSALLERRLSFVGGWDPVERLYYLSFTTGAVNTNNTTWAFSIDSGTWTEMSFSGGSIKPSCYWLMHNDVNRLKMYIGDSNGYAYETHTSGGNDGLPGGTEAGTTTGGSDTTVEDSGAAFYTTGDDLLGLSVAVQTTDPAREVKEITSNTSTVLTTGSWTVDPTSGKKYWVAPIEGILSLGRLDDGTTADKFFQEIRFYFQKQTHTVPIRLGYTIDGDTEPTTSEVLEMDDGFRVCLPVERIGIGISPYISIIGNDCPFELLKIEVEYILLGSQMPKH